MAGRQNYSGDYYNTDSPGLAPPQRQQVHGGAQRYVDPYDKGDQYRQPAPAPIRLSLQDRIDEDLNGVFSYAEKHSLDLKIANELDIALRTSNHHVNTLVKTLIDIAARMGDAAAIDLLLRLNIHALTAYAIFAAVVPKPAGGTPRAFSVYTATPNTAGRSDGAVAGGFDDSIPSHVPVEFRGVWDSMKNHPVAAMFSRMVVKELVKLGLKWQDFSDCYKIKLTPERPDGFDTWYVMKRWLSQLCRFKTAGLGSMSELSGPALSDVMDRLVKDIKTSMQNHQSAKTAAPVVAPEETAKQLMDRVGKLFRQRYPGNTGATQPQGPADAVPQQHGNDGNDDPTDDDGAAAVAAEGVAAEGVAAEGVTAEGGAAEEGAVASDAEDEGEGAEINEFDGDNAGAVARGRRHRNAGQVQGGGAAAAAPTGTADAGVVAGGRDFRRRSEKTAAGQQQGGGVAAAAALKGGLRRPLLDVINTEGEDMEAYGLVRPPVQPATKKGKAKR